MVTIDDCVERSHVLMAEVGLDALLVLFVYHAQVLFQGAGDVSHHYHDSAFGVCEVVLKVCPIKLYFYIFLF